MMGSIVGLHGAVVEGLTELVTLEELGLEAALSGGEVLRVSRSGAGEAVRL